MAHVKKNIVTEGLSGKVGGLVFRRHNGETIVAQAPEKTNVPPTDQRISHQVRFKRAVNYSKFAVNDPEIGPMYEAYAKKRGKGTPFNIAMSDFMKGPKVSEIILNGYAGQPGQKIGVRAEDNFMVKAVTVSILQADGTVLETGAATVTPLGDYEYVATAENTQLAGSRIVVEATDLPGNRVSEELLIES